jgi:hypothetical protein
MTGVLRPCLLTALVVSLTASATELLSDDFEEGSLAKWQCASCERPPSSVRISPLAAHRGTKGFRLDDAENSAGAGSGASAYVDLGARPNLYARTWVRLTQTNAVGDSMLLDVFASTVNLNNVYLETSGSLLTLAGDKKPGLVSRSPTSATLSDGNWHLLEAAATGGGTANGARTLWLDGVQLAAESGLDWTSAAWIANTFALGQAWSVNRQFVGTVDFDDVRVSDAPLASRWVLVPAAQPVEEGACVPLEVELQDSLGALAPAPYAVAFAVTGPVTLFSEPTCSQSLTSPTLPIATSRLALYARFDSVGNVGLGVSHPDFLATTASWVVQGASEGAREHGFYSVSCAQAPASDLAGWLILLPALAARISSRCGGRRAGQSPRCAPSSKRFSRTV